MRDTKPKAKEIAKYLFNWVLLTEKAPSIQEIEDAVQNILDEEIGNEIRIEKGRLQKDYDILKNKVSEYGETINNQREKIFKLESLCLGEQIYCRYCYKNTKPYFGQDFEIFCYNCKRSLTLKFYNIKNFKNYLKNNVKS